MAQTGLIVWMVMGIFTGTTDTVMAFRRCTGKLGDQVRCAYLETAEKFGGMQRCLIIGFIIELFIWPFGLVSCLYLWVRDWRTYQAELARSAPNNTKIS
jgi:hypothetical protein